MFETEVFISYAHLDNQSARQGHEWITDFHRCLGIRTAMLLGRELQIWRDPKLQGNDDFEATLLERLKRVAVLVSVLTPRYVKSEWTRRELEEFCHAAHETGGLQIADKARIFKVIKTPIPRQDEVAPLQRLLGYEFFRTEPATGRQREFDDPNDIEYWTKIDDIAHDMCDLLKILEGESSPSTDRKTIYLAETTFDLKAEYWALRRDLQQHGQTVLPSEPLPLVEADLIAFVQKELAQADFAVHLIGKTFSFVPEGSMRSVLELQDELALERAEKGNFERLVWIAPGLEVRDPRQANFIERLKMNPRLQHATDLLETSLEDLRTSIHERLKPKSKEPVREEAKPAASPASPSSTALKQVYLVFDVKDQQATLPWQDFLFSHFEVICPVFEGDEAEIRDFHEENLRTCDAVLIYYGAGSEIWLRRKLRELLKSAAYGRSEPFQAVGILVAPPLTTQKSLFKTHEAILIPQPEGFSPDPLLPFIEAAKVK